LIVNMRVLLTFGTRPEAIKMAPIIEAMAQQPELFEARICVTAQHREMLDDVLDIFNIQPDYDLNLMRQEQTLSSLTARIFDALDPVMSKEDPDWVLVQGDTTTTMAASLVAYYHRIKIGHVEAGLRTHDKLRPFPEEINRRIAGTVADIHFAPTETARENLIREGIDERDILVTGNTAIDALLQVLQRHYDFDQGPLAEIPLDKKILLVTAHRRENFGEPVRAICRALEVIAERYAEDVHIVYPVHLNSNVSGPVHALLSNVSNITLLKPLDYLSFVHLMHQSHIVLTDSGGLQEEAPSLGKPVLVLRSVTERPEAVEAGTARVVGTQAEQIVREVEHLLADSTAYAKMASAVNPYGLGRAADQIVKYIAPRQPATSFQTHTYQISKKDIPTKIDKQVSESTDKKHMELQYWIRLSRELTRDCVTETEKEEVLLQVCYEKTFPRYKESLYLDDDSFMGKKILDVGCGPHCGIIGFRGCEKYGIDPLIEGYIHIGYPLSRHGVDYYNCRSEEMPFGNKFFDVVICVNALDHVDDLAVTIKEIARVLKGGGKFISQLNFHNCARKTEPICLNHERISKHCDASQLQLKKAIYQYHVPEMEEDRYYYEFSKQ